LNTADHKRILIIEDEWLIAMVIERTLTQAGLVVAGKSGSVGRARHLIETTSCDAVVLDANLGGASAEPLAVLLRTRGTPFAVVTGYASTHRSGALATAPYLGKPFQPAQLVDIVVGLVT
jgi:DNA-binding response OmpR family regulator